MKDIFIIHGSHGNPEENWFPWLKKELEKLGENVIVPQFPPSNSKTGEERLNEWFKAFEKYQKGVNKNTILVAHSKGCIFIYHLLSHLKHRVQAVFLIGPWFEYHWYKKDKPVSSFHVESFRWDKLINKAMHFEIYQSTNDVIKIWEGERIAKDIGGKLVIVKNAGHFNTKAGYTTFPLLLENIKHLLNSPEGRENRARKK